MSRQSRRKAADRQSQDRRAGGKQAKGRQPSRQPSSKQASDRHLPDWKPTDWKGRRQQEDRRPPRQPSGERSPRRQNLWQLSGDRPTNDRPTNEQPTSERLTHKQGALAWPTLRGPQAAQPPDSRLAGSPAAGDRPAKACSAPAWPTDTRFRAHQQEGRQARDSRRKQEDSLRAPTPEASPEKDKDPQKAPRQEASRNWESKVRAIALRLGELAREYSKDKAGKAFTKQYGDTASQAASSGPRAAVYKGEMGRQHKRITQLQQNFSAKGALTGGWSASISGWSAKLGLSGSPRLMTGMILATCLFFSCCFLYAPTKQYYLTLRHYDQLEAEYVALRDRNQTIQKQVDSLSSPDGLEERARKELGWTKEGEHSGTVVGLEASREEADRTKSIAPGSVEPPRVWYTSFLDMLFGVKRA
ncbi:MAG: septum formation initiator family protein [Coriobacteriaceae bacterium]|nr:septum formation initiator family protein [Coriobacteriaceae bacterium]